MFQLILNPTRDWNIIGNRITIKKQKFQLILNPTRDWNANYLSEKKLFLCSN